MTPNPQSCELCGEPFTAESDRLEGRAEVVMVCRQIVVGPGASAAMRDLLTSAHQRRHGCDRHLITHAECYLGFADRYELA